MTMRSVREFNMVPKMHFEDASIFARGFYGIEGTKYNRPNKTLDRIGVSATP